MNSTLGSVVPLAMFNVTNCPTEAFPYLCLFQEKQRYQLQPDTSDITAGLYKLKTKLPEKSELLAKIHLAKTKANVQSG